MLHHHFPQLVSPLHDGVVSGRDIAQFARINPATKAITKDRSAPPPSKISRYDIFASSLIHDPNTCLAVMQVNTLITERHTYQSSAPSGQVPGRRQSNHYASIRLHAPLPK